MIMIEELFFSVQGAGEPVEDMGASEANFDCYQCDASIYVDISVSQEEEYE